MPSNNTEDPPIKAATDPADREDASLDTLIPAESNRPYDIKKIITAVVDDGHFVDLDLVDLGPIPEPDTALLLGLGLGILAVQGRRR